MKIAIVGGGFAGLTAGYFLSQKGNQVTIFEKEPILGGLSSSFKSQKWNWSLERFYHHFFTSDGDFLNLVRKLGIEEKIIWGKPKTSVFCENEIYRFDTPQSLLSFPKLNLIDKIRTAAAIAYLKVNPFWKPLEKIPAFPFIKKIMGENTFNLIWKPLFVGKFGSFAPQIPASWFWTRIHKRSSSLGYLQGGTETLISALTVKIKEKNGEILLNTPIEKIIKDGNAFVLTFAKNKTEKFDRVIFTGSPTLLAKIAPSFVNQELLGSLKSLGSLCLVVSLKKSFLNEETYWLNINDESFPFVSVVQHTNFIDKKNYDNEQILYVGGYYPTDHPFFKLDKSEILEEFKPFLNKINPSFDFNKDNVVQSWVFKETYSQPIVDLNYSHTLSQLKTNIPGFYWTSLHHVYPQDRGVNYAIAMGKKASNIILSEIVCPLSEAYREGSSNEKV